MATNPSRVAVDREGVIMAVVEAAGADVERVVDTSLVVLERLESYASEMLSGAMNRPVQMTNGSLYLPRW